MRRFEEIDSTNRWLLEQARSGAAEGLVAVAGHQTAGRGRLGRKWEAPPGSALLVSVLLRPSDLEPERLHLVTAAVGLAAAEACTAVTGGRVSPGLKWPNDLVVGDSKLAGVLAEAALPAVVVGCGVNVTWAPEGASCLGDGVTPDGLLVALLERLGHWYGRWDDVASAYRLRCSTLGRLVRVELADETFTGHAADVTDDGHLLVDVGVCLRTVTAGDVVHLRPA